MKFTPSLKALLVSSVFCGLGLATPSAQAKHPITSLYEVADSLLKTSKISGHYETDHVKYTLNTARGYEYLLISAHARLSHVVRLKVLYADGSLDEFANISYVKWGNANDRIYSEVERCNGGVTYGICEEYPFYVRLSQPESPIVEVAMEILHGNHSSAVVTILGVAGTVMNTRNLGVLSPATRVERTLKFKVPKNRVLDYESVTVHADACAIDVKEIIAINELGEEVLLVANETIDQEIVNIDLSPLAGHRITALRVRSVLNSADCGKLKRSRLRFSGLQFGPPPGLVL